MKSLTQQLESCKLLLTVLLSVSFFTGASSVTANEIKNQASASGDNLPDIVNSNETSLVAGQAALELIKTADRAAAEPGDTIVYRLALKNTGESSANTLVITDTLPLGLQYLPESLRGAIGTGTTTTPVDLPPATQSNRTLTFTYPRLEPNQTLTIVYAAVATPDAIRGDGRNVAQESRSNIATFEVRIRPGILSDCGTIVGRVFVDKNFDGEQQRGEPGVPNAVIYMDNGNRITTDANGLFSLANVIAGHRVGTLDLSSLPGYSLAPNLYFIEGNSQSRLVRLQPGGLVRMNFGVTPAYGEEQL
ncbi:MULTISPECIES: DUF11 domain-containing protein [unclassified Coleofasciculus]|uniref:DUF11 domain-containing protein n=1 Tax=unclassified Coleofasciculus TaxID=2692782 RepID=UPI001881AB10|nr:MULTISPECIES: DUF11 domain-containing protein [unclassified Coleofasciculus]MBE9129264.1 DUF11 domain-containing protein [Coleofasciculus sp. LEGE 07081]MBE9147430.1 DUF11 domain-containing protein [Coleofasciculus sp. LEGE 07092]